MQQPHLAPRQRRAPLLGHGRGGPHVLELLGLLHQRVDHVGLAAREQLAPHQVDDLAPARGRQHQRADRRAPGRPLVDDRQVEVAVGRERQRARDGRGGHHQHVHVVALAAQLVALQHAEAVLLVHHRQAEALEGHLLLDQRVGADRDLRLPRQEPRQGRAPGRALEGRGEELDRVVAVLQPAAQVVEVLLGQDLGGRHEGRLVAVLDRHQHGQQRHHRLAGAHVALQQPVHRARRAQVVGDLAQHAPLGAGQPEGQHALDRLALARADLEGQALAQGALARVARGQPELEQEQLLEDQAAVPRAAGRVERPRVLALLRQVHAAQGGPQPDHPQRGAGLAGQRVGQVVREALGQGGQHAPQQVARQRPELLVDRHDAAGVQPAGLVALQRLHVRGGEHGTPAAPGVGLDGTVQHQPAPAHDHVLQVGLVEPDRLAAPRLVLQPGLEQGHAARAAHSGNRHRADHRGALARHQVGQAHDAAAVLVAQRQVQQQVLDPLDPQAGQGCRPRRADALDELDRRLEVDHARIIVQPRDAGGPGRGRASTPPRRGRGTAGRGAAGTAGGRGRGCRRPRGGRRSWCWPPRPARPGPGAR